MYTYAAESNAAITALGVRRLLQHILVDELATRRLDDAALVGSGVVRETTSVR